LTQKQFLFTIPDKKSVNFLNKGPQNRAM